MPTYSGRRNGWSGPLARSANRQLAVCFGQAYRSNGVVISMASLLGVAALSLGMVLTPGPNMMYLVSRSITQGRRAGLVSLGGVAIGFLIYLTATNLGLAVVFVEVPELYTALRVA